MTWASATIAVISACVCLWYAVKAVRADRARMRRGRDAVWMRRIERGRLWIPEPDDDYPGSAVVYDIRGD